MEDRRAVGVAAASLYNSYEFYFGPRKGNAMTKDHMTTCMTATIARVGTAEDDEASPISAVRLLRG